MTNQIIGQRFGRLSVIHIATPKKKSKRVLCICDCGKEHIVNINSLRSGATSSCGCLRNERVKKSNSTHGLSSSETYKRWQSMKARCLQIGSKSYHQYGGRGIKICDEWIDSFEQFHKNLGDCPGKEWTLERNDSNGNYELLNCRWATRKEQNRNTSRNHLIEFNGKNLCVSEWSEILGLNIQTILSRIRRGWPVEKTLGIYLK